MALIFWPLLRYSLPICTLYELGERSNIHSVTGSERVGQRPRERKTEILGGGGGERQRPREGGGQRWGLVEQRLGGGQGPRGRAGSAQSTRAHVLQQAVGSSKHPVLVDQHASTVELIASEQGHLPGLGTC